MAEGTEAGGRPRPLVRTMMAKLQSYSVTGTQDEPCSIHRVPPNIREGDPGSYEPQILSIGPYHHGNPKLQAMEEHKWRYLHNLLGKHPSHSIESLLEGCIEVVRGSEARARRSHEQEEVDPIINVGWLSSLVRRDILKLENQIPFFILEELFDVVAVERGITDWSLRQHAFNYLMLRRAVAPLTEHKIYHLLHFYDVILLPNKSANTSTNTRPSSCFTVQPVLMKMRRSFTLPTWSKPKPTDKMCETTIPCAVELGEVGIKLRTKPAETFLDVTFQDGTLGIPRVSIDDDTNSVFRNLVALEQCCPNLGSHFTWYVMFLDCIVNTPQDVSILQNRGIVENMLGSEEVVAQLINQLGQEMTIYRTNHNFKKLFREVNKHCQSTWHKHRARLMRDYFSSPWSIISLVAAVFLLLMTAAQVVLAVLSYKKQ